MKKFIVGLTLLCSIGSGFANCPKHATEHGVRYNTSIGAIGFLRSGSPDLFDKNILLICEYEKEDGKIFLDENHGMRGEVSSRNANLWKERKGEHCYDLVGKDQTCIKCVGPTNVCSYTNL